MTTERKQVALVTGGRSGIGQACARNLANQGIQVFTAQRHDDPEFESICADLTDTDAPRQIIEYVTERAGKLDILINNAGIMLEATVEEMSVEDWDLTVAVNLRAPFLLIKQALPYLRDGGRIVNIGSIEGLGSNARHPAYCASKAGLHALTRAVAVDHGPDGIRCNAVAPGWIDTELNTNFIASMPDPARFR
nr:SDR family oxidoreductase [Alphaproteobacteria bacterium]